MENVIAVYELPYDPHKIDALPPAVAESFCGVGNPLGLGAVRSGQIVLVGQQASIDNWRGTCSLDH